MGPFGIKATPCRRADQTVTALAVIWAKQEVKDGAVSVIFSMDKTHFPMFYLRVSRRTVSSDLLFADQPDGVCLVCGIRTHIWLCSCAAFGPMEHASVLYRHVSGGAVSPLLCVVARGFLQIAKERRQALTFSDICVNSGPS